MLCVIDSRWFSSHNGPDSKQAMNGGCRVLCAFRKSCGSAPRRGAQRNRMSTLQNGRYHSFQNGCLASPRASRDGSYAVLSKAAIDSRFLPFIIPFHIIFLNRDCLLLCFCKTSKLCDRFLFFFVIYAKIDPKLAFFDHRKKNRSGKSGRKQQSFINLPQNAGYRIFAKNAFQLFQGDVTIAAAFHPVCCKPHDKIDARITALCIFRECRAGPCICKHRKAVSLFQVKTCKGGARIRAFHYLHSGLQSVFFIECINL